MRALFLVLTFFVSTAFADDSDPRVIVLSPEQTGILQTGGLAHATTGLAKALNGIGIRTEVLMPYYTEMNAPGPLIEEMRRLHAPVDWQNGRPQKWSQFTVLRHQSSELNTVFLRHDPTRGERNYFDNRSEGSTKKGYGPEDRIGESFGAFAKAAAEYIVNQGYDIAILNDWTMGLVAVHIEEMRRHGIQTPKVIFAIHNIAYQGVFPKSLVDFLGLSERHFRMEGYEYYGKVNFLKAGLQYSDMVYTVSQKYADEITTARFGMGLDGVMRKKLEEGRLTGILNGIDSREWDPRKSYLPEMTSTFSADDLSGKATGKAELQASFGLPTRADVPVFILTSRLAEQKGFEYLLEALSDAVSKNEMQVLIIGDGEPNYVEKAKSLEKSFPERVRYSRFSTKLEKLATAYGDFFVNAAWFEPSGLNQFFALANGTIPVVSEVGGLASSVHRGQNGLTFPIVEGANGQSYDVQATRQAIVKALNEAVALYQHQPGLIHQMRVHGMKESHSWGQRVTREFLPLFEYVMANGPSHHANEDHVPSTAELRARVGTGPRLLRGLQCKALFTLRHAN